MFRLDLPLLSIRSALRGLGLLLGLIGACAALGPARAAGETVTIGNPLSESEVLLALCHPCTVLQTVQAGATVTSPADGAVTAWRYRSADEGAEYQLEVLHPTGGTSYSLSARSPTVKVPDSQSTSTSPRLCRSRRATASPCTS